MVDEQRAVARSASQKPYSPSPDAGLHEDDGSGDLLSRSPVHAGGGDGVGYGGGAVQRKANPRLFFTYVAER